MTKRHSFLIIVLLLTSVLKAQVDETRHSLDSLHHLLVISPKKDTNRVAIYRELSYTYCPIDPMKSLIYGRKTIALAKKIHWKKGIADGCFAKAEALFMMNKTNAAIDYHKFAKTIYRELNERKMLAFSHYRIGAFYASQGKYAQALISTYNYLKLSEESHRTRDIAIAYSNIANIHDDLKQFSSALKNYRRALNQFRKLNDYSSVANTLLEISIGLDKQKKYSTALKNGFEALAIYKRMNNPWGIAFAHAILGTSYNHINQYDKARYFLEKSTAWYESKDQAYYLSFCYEGLGISFLNTYKKKGKKELLDKAFGYALKAININQHIDNLLGLQDCYKTLSDCYKAGGNYQKALEATEKSMGYKDAIYNSENKETVKTLEDRHTIEVTQKEIQIAKLSLEVKERQKWILISGIVLLSIILSLLFYQSQNRKKTNSRLQLLNTELDASNNTKLRFFNILNHDLRSPVASLINFLHVQKENPELLNDETRKRIEAKTMKSAENLLDSMEDILLWSKGQMEHFKPLYSSYAISPLLQSIQNHFSSVENVRFHIECPEQLSLTTDENYLKTILRNLTGNAIKALQHKADATITWKAWEENHLIYVSISDNGTGGTPQQFKALYDDSEVTGIKSGLGLHLIRDLATIIDCTITVETQLEVGTTFTLVFNHSSLATNKG